MSATIRQFRTWQDGGVEIPVALNLSMRDLHNAHLPETIDQLLATWDVPPI